jgi:hypothetical protein
MFIARSFGYLSACGHGWISSAKPRAARIALRSVMSDMRVDRSIVFDEETQTSRITLFDREGNLAAACRGARKAQQSRNHLAFPSGLLTNWKIVRDTFGLGTR